MWGCVPSRGPAKQSSRASPTPVEPMVSRIRAQARHTTIPHKQLMIVGGDFCQEMKTSRKESQRNSAFPSFWWESPAPAYSNFILYDFVSRYLLPAYRHLGTHCIHLFGLIVKPFTARLRSEVIIIEWQTWRSKVSLPCSLLVIYNV